MFLVGPVAAVVLLLAEVVLGARGLVLVLVLVLMLLGRTQTGMMPI